MSYTSVNLDPSKLLTAISANLDSQFYGASRDHSKRIYADISDGQHIPFVELNTQDSGDVTCNLALDSSQYTGKLNFGKFRKALAVMLLGIKNRIEEDKPLNILNSNLGDVMFNIPGVLQNEDGTNIMVCGIRQVEPGLITIRLMFLDPVHYQAAAKKVAVNVEQDESIKNKA